MRRTHVVAVAVLIGIAAALGTYAATRTSDLGVQARKGSDKAAAAQIAAKTKRLDALEASLHKALARKPPALPPLPKAQPQSQAPQRLVYTAPQPTVIRSASPAPAARSGEQESAHAASGGEHDD